MLRNVAFHQGLHCLLIPCLNKAFVPIQVHSKVLERNKFGYIGPGSITSNKGNKTKPNFKERNTIY